MTEEDRERPTDPVGTKPPESAEVIATNEMPPPAPMPAETRASAETWAGYDENSFMHRATAAVIDGTAELLKGRKDQDIPALLESQRKAFEDTVSAGHRMIMGPVEETNRLVKDLVTRMVTAEGRLDNLDGLRTEFELMKTRMAQIEIALGLRAGG